MKIKKLSLLITTFILVSCNVDNTTEDESEAFIDNEQKVLISNNALRSISLSNAEILENRMQWVSYMAAHVIIHNVDARNQFKNEANNILPRHIVTLEDLIDDPTNLSFKNAFKDVFLYNYYESNPCTDGGRPRGRPEPVGEISGIQAGPDYDTAVFNSYIDLLLIDCFEFYLPNGFIFLQSIGTANDTNSFIYSTSHPLNNSNYNNGYKHRNSCSVENIDVDDSTSGFVLVLRPFRKGRDCLYTNYSNIEFEDFLN